MLEQAPARQEDETICLRCNQVVKRDTRICPQCGSPIAAGPQHARAQSNFDPVARTTYRAPIAHTVQDEVGAGRYILNFFLAGLVGLALTYFLRGSGWMATWICAAIFVLGVVYFATAGAPSP